MEKVLYHYLIELRKSIISAFEKLENGAVFEYKPWNYQKGNGGGEIALLRGKVFEKAAVNFSSIEGDSFPMQDSTGPFKAMGVSLITHMNNPHAPTVHMNLRYIQTKEKSWLGGGYDLTPMGFFYEEDRNHFHHVAKMTLDQHDTTLYPTFAESAKNYFFIPHRQKERGVGGLFFDHFNRGNLAEDVEIWKAIGDTFLQAIVPIYEKRIAMPFSSEDKALQLEWRGHYVEFNLLYDRGTKFGFLSGGNPEAILCSMPPLAKW